MYIKTMPKRGRSQSASGASRKRARYNRRKSIYKRRKWQTKRRRGGASTKIMRSIPDRMLVKLSYIDTFQSANIALTAGRPTVQLLKSYRSSTFDPDFAVGGHQPLWYDQYQTLYQKYRVYGIKYDITVQNVGQNEVFYVLVRPGSAQIVESNYETLMERKNCQWRVGGSVNGGGRIRLKGYMSVAKTLGVPKKQVALDDEFESAWGNNPPKQAFLNMYVANWLGSGTTLTYTVRLTYFASLHDRVTPAGS